MCWKRVDHKRKSPDSPQQQQAASAYNSEKRKRKKTLHLWHQFNEKLSIIPGCPGHNTEVTSYTLTCMELLCNSKVMDAQWQQRQHDCRGD